MTLESIYIDKVSESFNKVISDTVIKRILVLCPEFDQEKEQKRRFQRFHREIRGEVTSFYFNDGSERGVHLFSYMIKYPQFNFNTVETDICKVELIEVEDPSLTIY